MIPRGGLPYFQPIGWYRFGLNIETYNSKDRNSDWIGMNRNPNEWAVFFHGLKDPKNSVLPIIKTNFKSGKNQAHSNADICIPDSLFMRLK